MLPHDFASDLLVYMVEHQLQPGDQLPTLTQLSDELGISVNKLREQLEVARILGLVDVRPRAGIRVKAYSFLPAVRLSLMYALSMNNTTFRAFGDLRISIEVGFWHDAVSRLKPSDINTLSTLVKQAWHSLNGTPVRLPHREHREFHLMIFSRLENPFAAAMLEAFWEAYEAEEFHVYADYAYLREVWTYHERIVNAIRDGDIAQSLAIFIEHTQLLRYRNSPGSEHPVAVGMTSFLANAPDQQQND